MSLIVQLRDARTLSPAELNVAQYIIGHPKEVLTLSCSQLAKRTYTSASTVVRLCKRIGIKGFPEFKVQLASELNTFTKNSLHIKENRQIKPDDSLDSIIQMITDINIDSLKEAKILLDDQVLERVVAAIDEAKIIDIYGVGASHFVALDANYKFLRVGKNSATYALSDQQYIQAQNSDEDHLAIIFSYSGQTKELLELAEILSKNGTMIVSVTSSTDNDLMRLADESIFVSARETIFRSAAISSRITMLNVIDVLYTAYSNLHYEATLESLAKTHIEKTKSRRG